MAAAAARPCGGACRRCRLGAPLDHLARGRGGSQWPEQRRAHSGIGPPQVETETIGVTFVDKAGREQHVRVPLGMSMLEAAHQNDIDLEGACEGSLACSTCHVIVMDEEYFQKMEEPSDEENDMLDLAFGLCETSRLGCQVIASKEFDGLRLALPAATRRPCRPSRRGSTGAAMSSPELLWDGAVARFRYPVLVALAQHLLYLCLVNAVGKARWRHRVWPPAVSGHPDFDRIFRVQANFVEQQPGFLAGMFLTAAFVDGRLAAALGAAWVALRAAHSWRYAAARLDRTIYFYTYPQYAVVAAMYVLPSAAVLWPIH
eukprot:SM000007S20829  [mRNA]  locus=s7:460239:466679:- [translate_table: standard]